MDSNYIEKIAHLEEHLTSQIIGQDKAIKKACSVLQRGALKLSHPDRPLGSFLFVGPTGVGKTELTKCFTKYLFPGEHRLIRFDMSEYQNKEQLEVLLGDGTNAQGQMGRLFDLNRDGQGNLRGGTILFDEIEKAHPDLLLILLQVLEDGRLTLRDGTTLNLRDFFVVLTSNIGASEAMEMRKSTPETIERVVFSLVREKLRRELVGRITEMIMFERLEYDVQVKIARLMMEREVERLSGQLGMTITFDEDVLEFILIEGFDSRFGARPLRRCIERLIGNMLIKKIMKIKPPSGTLMMDEQKGALHLRAHGVR
ncbi:ATP-dependent Clp protease ATP-binding subunit [Ruficoccus amylovorans]|uniref:ATP-dependent Clp protease ATP-binding subunit n=1 Tax=Ruficoccus amylovorans TaxID=1804625 RepID=A0A842HB94_9BACT|nr:AAA family ATPase [Ruficoccus amylovorans]MBC2592844.1 ATP-dependent Clp protease ATP-binding subunit [Ruficoccus amylovorans]